jgi:hypothetical protein
LIVEAGRIEVTIGSSSENSRPGGLFEITSANKRAADGLRVAFSKRGAKDCELGAIAIVLDSILHEMVIS